MVDEGSLWRLIIRCCYHIVIKAQSKANKWEDSVNAFVFCKLGCLILQHDCHLQQGPESEQSRYTFLVRNVCIQVKRRLSRDYESFGETARARSEHLRFTAGIRRGDKCNMQRGVVGGSLWRNTWKAVQQLAQKYCFTADYDPRLRGNAEDLTCMVVLTFYHHHFHINHLLHLLDGPCRLTQSQFKVFFSYQETG